MGVKIVVVGVCIDRDVSVGEKCNRSGGYWFCS